MPNALRIQPTLCSFRGVNARIILHKQLRTLIIRKETFSKSLNVTFSAVSFLRCLLIMLYNDKFAPP
jgi:hypothetical protein